MHRGSCLCGTVRYEFDGALGEVTWCHCSQCRKASGSAFSPNVSVAASALRWTQGREAVREYASSPGKVRAFCGRCGSPLYSARGPSPQVLRLRIGTLDDAPPGLRHHHIHVASKAPWFDVDDGAPRHVAERPAGDAPP